jgi:spore coat polysaccharide biosynthesis predicted glycosyltransferase SpsG
MRLLSNLSDISQWMAWAELGISAGGGTCYELALLRVPMLLVTMATNHKKTIQAISDRKAAVNAGWFHLLERSQLASLLRSVIADRRLRKELVMNAAHMVDSNGAQRVIQVMRSVSADRPQVIK